MKELSDLICPFHHLDEKYDNIVCDFRTGSAADYIEHTKTHKPHIMKPEDRLWELRLKIAQSYAGMTGDKHPKEYAVRLWKRKPKNADCGSYTAMIQDQGVLDGDNFHGLDVAVAGL